MGKGKITADVVFTVCSEKLIFLKYLKLKCFFKLPLLTTQTSIRSMQLNNSKKVNQPAAFKKPIIWYIFLYSVCNLVNPISTVYIPK